jgi:hypothetical protein
VLVVVFNGLKTYYQVKRVTGERNGVAGAGGKLQVGSLVFLPGVLYGSCINIHTGYVGRHTRQQVTPVSFATGNIKHRKAPGQLQSKGVPVQVLIGIF